MSNTRNQAAKETVGEKTAEVTPITPNPEPLSPEIQALLEEEQNKLNAATMQSQLNYLSGRVAELMQENYELRQELNK